MVAEEVNGLLPNLVGIGHRVVHGGHKWKAAQLITDQVKASIEDSAVFAPLHNRNSLKGNKNRNYIQCVFFGFAQFHFAILKYKR